MKNRKKKTGRIRILAAVMMLTAAMGLFNLETVLAAEQGKAVTAFQGASQLYEAERSIAVLGAGTKAVKLPKIGLPHIEIPHIELPEIDFSKLDKEAEKEKLREALEEMDRMGISPKILLRRAWTYFFPKDTEKKAGKTSDPEDAEKKAGKTSDPEDAEKKAGKTSDPKDTEKKADKTADSQDAESVTEKVKKKASEEFDKAVDQAAEKVKKKASEEVDKAVEQAVGGGKK
ncbi:MAG: hypothetical protein E7237_06135 [Sarcina sp.]|nr:hypothetical protein [Sarcina sp.]